METEESQDTLENKEDQTAEPKETLMNLEVGTKEKQKLEAEDVEIVLAKVETIGEKGHNKVVCQCRHPKREDLIALSGVRFIEGDAVKELGLWVNLDEDKKILKGSALALLLEKSNSSNIEELKGKKLPTEQGKTGYLCFKLY